jgi:hypothetical protein
MKSTLMEIDTIIQTHTKKLNIMKSNLSKCDEENWTDAEIQQCRKMIETLASILSDLNRAMA